ncbi:uncharacterized protein LOC134844163 [Symsagittifera roscoffensis]|uniref:uncharacterized protein LOC134844163 n=1 Tax=Symsagittifera roscoffensis TaxID=84072 RepID=UPI00307CBE07
MPPVSKTLNSQRSVEVARNEKYANVNLDKVGDLKMFTEELLYDYRNQNKRLDELEFIVKHMTAEQSSEKNDERRINLLKMQVLQLERQIQVLYEGIKQRTGLISDAVSTIDRSCDDLRRFVAQDVGSTEVSVPRRVLISSVEHLNGAKNQLSQSCHVLDSVALGKPVLFDAAINSSVWPANKAEVSFRGLDPDQGNLSLLDLIVSSTFQEKLNLISLPNLESLVSNVHKDLTGIKQAVCNLNRPISMLESTAIDCLSLPLDKLNSQVSCCLHALESVSSELLLLAFLFPQLSVKKRKKKAVKIDESGYFITQQSVYKAFAPFLKNTNVVGVSEVIGSFIDCMQLQCNVSNHVRQAAENECKFYSSVYELQIKYQTDLFELTQVAFENFNKDLKQELCDPLADVLTHYERLTQKPTDENLKTFLKVFKQHADKITKSNYAILRNDDKGQSAISEFGSGFQDSVLKLRRKRVADIKDEALALEDAENDWKRFLIYNPNFEKDSLPENIAGSDSSRPSTQRSSRSTADRSSQVRIRTSSITRSSEKMNPKETLPNISPTHVPKDHGLPVVKSKKKRPPRVSSQYPLPDMEF